MSKNFTCQKMRCLILILFLSLIQAPICLSHTFDMASEKVISFEELITDLKKARVVFIGEAHDNLQHHLAQLQIIKELASDGVKLAIGLGMFRSDSQAALDSWVAGNMTFHDFLQVYHDNWTYWQEYADIYLYAREKKIPMIGLNISRQITRLVAEKGFDGLSEEQLKKLPVVQCKVDKPYMDFIRRALGGHGMQGKQFRYFCEAQMLWDKIMAKNLKDFLEENQDTKVVVLAGSGHSWKYGIPAQLDELGKFPYRVLLPEIPGRLAQEGASIKDTDYLMLGIEEGPLH